jgi:hypothetical protein
MIEFAENPPKLAVIVTVFELAAMTDTKPVDETVATPVLLDTQVALEEQFCEGPEE